MAAPRRTTVLPGLLTFVQNGAPIAAVFVANITHIVPMGADKSRIHFSTTAFLDVPMSFDEVMERLAMNGG